MTMSPRPLDLEPTPFIECGAPSVRAFAQQAVAGANGEKEKGISLFYAVRDQIRYDPYAAILTLEGLKATTTLKRGKGFCVAKAILLAAAARSVSIPARLGFADVKNHLNTQRLQKLMGSDLFVYHGYTVLYLDGRWVKATPTFNMSLCEKFDVPPLDFDGVHDALFHSYNADGHRHMEYVVDHGEHDDVPLKAMTRSWLDHYPHLLGTEFARDRLEGDFAAEAEAEAEKNQE